MSSRLPIPGQDEGTWGDLLNDYLLQSHGSDGLLKSSVVGASQLKNSTISIDKLSPELQDTITAAATGVKTINGDSADSNGNINISAGDINAITLTDANNTFLAIADKGQANGVASLDNSSKIPENQLPNISITDGNILAPGLQPTSIALPWLKVIGSRVYEGTNGPRFKATGYNCYVMRRAGGSTAQTLNDNQRDLFFAKLRPNSLVRVWAMRPKTNTFSWSDMLSDQDAIVSSAKKYGHRLIFTLADWWGHANDADGLKTSGWFTSQTWSTSNSGSTSYESWVTTNINRYEDEPTVAIYDLINEPQDESGSITLELTTFANYFSTLIKSINPNALVYIGAQGSSYIGGDSAYQQIFAKLDLCSSHQYTGNGFFKPNNAAIALNKPEIIDEYGFFANSQYGNYYDTVKDSNGLPAISFHAQAVLTESFLKSAFSYDSVCSALIWSYMDTDTGGWYAGDGMYEPLIQSQTHSIVKEIDLYPFDINSSSIGNLQGWIEASFSLRYRPGSQIGGDANNYGASYLNYLYDRVNGYYIQSSQVNAPIARQDVVYVDSKYFPSLEFNGSQNIPASFWRAGSGSSSSNQQHTFLFVIYPTSLSTGTYHYIVAPNGGYEGICLRINGTTGAVEMAQFPYAPVSSTTSNVVKLNQINVIEAGWDGNSGVFYTMLNGKNGQSGSNGLKIFANDYLRIGCDNTNSNGFVGQLMEGLHFSALLTTGDRSRLRCYISHKYCIPDIY